VVNLIMNEASPSSNQRKKKDRHHSTLQQHESRGLHRRKVNLGNRTYETSYSRPIFSNTETRDCGSEDLTKRKRRRPNDRQEESGRSQKHRNRRKLFQSSNSSSSDLYSCSEIRSQRNVSKRKCSRERSRERHKNRRKRGSHHRRRHQQARERYQVPSAASSSKSPVSLEALEKSGIVSDEEKAGYSQPGKKISQLEFESNYSKYPHDVRACHSQNTTSPFIYDDSVGHFRGRTGTVVADRYRIIREVGLGTFGRVVECLDLKRTRGARGYPGWNTSSSGSTEVWCAYRISCSHGNQDQHIHGNGSELDHVAIKIVRDVPRYYEAAVVEARIVADVNRRGGRGISHCVLLHDAFSFQNHFCLVFEKLGKSLYDFLKSHDYVAFPMSCIRDFTFQLLETLEFLHSFGLIHTDLKMENILLVDDREVLTTASSYRMTQQPKEQFIPVSTKIKVIDFGGACYDTDAKSSIVNTRQYRAPEVILGVGWSMPSDMWSVGCILAELYQGELLFATHENREHLALMERIIGPFPLQLLEQARKCNPASAKSGMSPRTDVSHRSTWSAEHPRVDEVFNCDGKHRGHCILTQDSFEFVSSSLTLEGVVYRPEDIWFLRLLREILVLDPERRATAYECIQMLHRFNM
jgi:serine/threonine protein kinase